MNQSRERLEFIQPHDGNQLELDEHERASAAVAFEELCVNTLGNCIDLIDQFDLRGDSKLPFAVLSMYIDADDGTSLLLRFEDRCIVDGNKHNAPFRLSLREMDAEGDIHKTSVYSLSCDLSEVTRYFVDDRDISKPAQESRTAHDEVDDSSNFNKQLRSVLEVLIMNEENAVKNKSDMTQGLNDQPVSLAEIKQVEQLVSEATPFSG